MADRFLALTPPPFEQPISGKDGRLTDAWRNWFGRLPSTLASIPSILSTVALATQAASLSATSFQNYALLPGLYRASYHAQITRAATTSSSLTVAFLWTEGGIAQTATGDAIVGNTTGTGQSDQYLILVDAGTAVQYQTTYSSVGGTTMQYSLNVSLEKIAV